jgi:hypothetical protein
MNLKVANLIAVQFGIFIGIMSWLGYSRFQSAQPRTASEISATRVAPFETVSPVLEQRNQRPYPANYETDHEQAQPVDEEEAPVAPEYEQEIAQQPYPDSGGNRYVAADSPSYAEVGREPAVAQPDYVPSPQILVYAQPAQVVVFSNAGRFANRRSRSRPHAGTLIATEHRGPDRMGPDRRGNGIRPRWDPNTQSCPPTQGFGPRGHR